LLLVVPDGDATNRQIRATNGHQRDRWCITLGWDLRRVVPLIVAQVADITLDLPARRDYPSPRALTARGNADFPPHQHAEEDRQLPKHDVKSGQRVHQVDALNLGVNHDDPWTEQRPSVGS